MGIGMEITGIHRKSKNTYQKMLLISQNNMNELKIILIKIQGIN